MATEMTTTTTDIKSIEIGDDDGDDVGLVVGWVALGETTGLAWL